MNKDKRIIKGIRNSEIEAFEELFDVYYDSLCIVAQRFVRSKQVAEEIVDDLFLHLWEIRKKLEVRDNLDSYLYRATYNRCISWIRKNSKERFLSGDLAFSSEDKILNIPDTSTSPLSCLMNKELRNKIDDAINQLPEKCRQIFILSREFDLTYQEVAQQLNLSKNTIKTQLKIALKKVRDKL
jgi:RNA polymerase sigma-70 factor (ECF subfamily)